MSEADTETVSFLVTGIERVYGRGDLVGMAVVELSVSGVEIPLQGLQVRRAAPNRLTVTLPTFKSPRDGVQRTAIVLPPELLQAIGTTVMERFTTVG